jgi:ABC-2 type transport system ATP-binding protein
LTPPSTSTHVIAGDARAASGFDEVPARSIATPSGDDVRAHATVATIAPVAPIAPIVRPPRHRDRRDDRDRRADRDRSEAHARLDPSLAVLDLIAGTRQPGPSRMGHTAQITVEGLVKTFQIAERAPGVWGAIRGLARRRHRTVRALDGISFSIQPGELVGYIGPNGAGKSTTVKTLAGILVPDAGRCEVAGRVPWRDRIAHVAEIGVVFGQRTQLWWDLPVIESFELLRDIYRVSEARYAAARDELIAMLDLAALLDVPVRQLSLGQRMRCDLAAALLHAPAILFLDEPTIGLDAVSKLAVRDFIRQLNRQRGVTVILTTHDMDDIEALCTRVIVIAGGKILSDGPLDELRAQVTRERWLTVDLVDAGAVITEPDAAEIRRDGHRVCLAFDPQHIAPAELIRRVTSRHAIRDLFVENPPIETIVARLYAALGGRSS